MAARPATGPSRSAILPSRGLQPGRVWAWSGLPAPRWVRVPTARAGRVGPAPWWCQGAAGRSGGRRRRSKEGRAPRAGGGVAAGVGFVRPEPRGGTGGGRLGGRRLAAPGPAASGRASSVRRAAGRGSGTDKERRLGGRGRRPGTRAAALRPRLAVSG